MTKDPAGQRATATPRALQQATLRAIIAQLADGIVVVDDAGIIRFANPAAHALFERDDAGLLGMPFGHPVLSEDAAEIEVVRPGGRVITAELRAVPLEWDGVPAHLVSLRDITERRAAEERDRLLEKERAAHARAEAAQQAKTEFLAMMSHELRTPLNAVLGYADLLALGLGGPLTDTQRQQLDRISASGRHLLNLVNEVLDLGRVEAGRLTVSHAPFAAAAVADATVVLLQPQAEARGLLLEARVDRSALLLARGDEHRTRQILVSLLSNAVKFTPAGGTISLVVEAVERPDPEAKVHGARRWIAFRVCDTGRGIEPDQVESVFAPFVQVARGHTRDRDGSGLGLTISRRLARLMNGDITVRTSPGKGSTFTLWLAEDVAPAAEAVSEAAPALSGHEPDVRGLGDVGDALLRETPAILDAFVERLRAEAVTESAPRLRFSQLADHVTTLLSDVAGALTQLEESGGLPSHLLEDGAEIRRLVAERHGHQRARLGWTKAALRRESTILREEVLDAIRRCASYDAQLASDAAAIVGGMLDDAERVSVQALGVAGRERR